MICFRIIQKCKFVNLERKINCIFIFLISLSYKKFILSLIKIVVLFSTPLVMLSTKNKDLMMNYVLTNNPKMLIQYSSSHSSSFYDRPSCLGLLFTLIFSLLINVFVRFALMLLFLVTRISNDSLQQYCAYRCTKQMNLNNIRSFNTIKNTREHSNKQAIRFHLKCLRVNIL